MSRRESGRQDFWQGYDQDRPQSGQDYHYCSASNNVCHQNLDRDRDQRYLVQLPGHQRGGAVVSWKTKRQDVVALSSTEAEFVSCWATCSKFPCYFIWTWRISAQSHDHLRGQSHLHHCQHKRSDVQSYEICQCSHLVLYSRSNSSWYSSVCELSNYASTHKSCYQEFSLKFLLLRLYLIVMLCTAFSFLLHLVYDTARGSFALIQQNKGSTNAGDWQSVSKETLFQSPAMDLHWAWTTEPGRGSRAESSACAVAGSGYAKPIFKLTIIYFWILIFHFVFTTVLNMEVSPPDLQYSSWRTTVRKTVRVRTSCCLRQDKKSIKIWMSSVHFSAGIFNSSSAVQASISVLAAKWRSKEPEESSDNARLTLHLLHLLLLEPLKTFFFQFRKLTL